MVSTRVGRTALTLVSSKRLARLRGFHGAAGLTRLADHRQRGEETEADMANPRAPTRHCLTRDHHVLPAYAPRFE